MSKYILISLFLFSLGNAGAQTVVVNKTEDKKDQHGISFGIDISPFILYAFQPDRIGATFLGRYYFKRNWYSVAEIGFENVDFDENSYAYTSNGGFLKIGAEYNFFKVNDPSNTDNITAGIRYGIATQSQQSPRYTIIDDYWGNYTGDIGLSTVVSHYIDLVAGIRTQVFKNFFMGWTFRLKVLMSSNSKTVLEPYSIPGYGKGDVNVNMGFTYTLEYQIPFKK